MNDLNIIRKHWEVGNLTSGQIAWLIEQVEELKTENARLNNVIGYYAGRMNDVAKENENIAKLMQGLSRKMFTA